MHLISVYQTLLLELFAVLLVYKSRVYIFINDVRFINLYKHYVFDVYWTVHHCDNWRIKNQLDATYYFIVLLIGSTCFGHCYIHHQELATMMLITRLVVLFLVWCRLEIRCGWAGVVSGLHPGHYSSPTAPNLQPTANQERNDQCGNQHHSRELLMMDIVMPETCWTYKKYNKIISGI